MTASFSKIQFLNSHLPWLIVMILIIIESSVSSDNIGSSFDSSDKISHFLVYGILGWLLIRAVFKQKNTFLQQNYFWIILSVVAAFAISDEIHQLYTPGRSFEVSDWIADMSGAALFMYIYKIRNKV